MGFLSFEHNVLFSFLSHSAQIFICWYIIEGWVSEGNLVRQGTLHENGESWAKKRIELLNNVSNWSYFVLKIYIKKNHVLWLICLNNFVSEMLICFTTGKRISGQNANTATWNLPWTLRKPDCYWWWTIY